MRGELPRTALDRVGRWARLRRAWLAASTSAAALLGSACRRLLDLLLALALTVLTAPIVVAAVAWAALRGRPAVTHRTYLGRWLEPLAIGELAAPGPLRHLPRVWAVLRGDLSFVGPGLLPAGETGALAAADLVRFQLRPGLADLFGLRRAANIAFEGRRAADAELVHASTLLGDLGILARSLPAALIGGGIAVPPPPRLDILGVRIDNWTMEQAVEWLVGVAGGEVARQLAFVNPDCLNKAWELPDYRGILSSCDVVLPDGIGIHYACRVLGTALAANVNGTDLFPRLCGALEGTGRALYLLGAQPGVTEALVDRMVERWPGLDVAGHRHGFFERGGDEEAQVVRQIRESGADTLLVAFGVPHQERWIHRHRARLGVRVALGVGGLFDFYSGRIRRAPGWMRELGLEWSWRLLQEPGRMWRRYVIGNPLFLWRVWRWYKGGSRQPSADSDAGTVPWINT